MTRLLRRLLRLPGELTPPPGSEATLRRFQPSRRLYQLELLLWSAKQAAAVAGIAFSIALYRAIGLPFLDHSYLPDAPNLIDASIGLGPVRLTVGSLLAMIEGGAMVTFLVQLVISWAMLRIGWTMRWYMVSDDSIRLREGVFRIREQTMSIANIQNMEIRRGPLQGLVGVADLEVHTAGGGAKAGDRDEHGTPKGIHIARFRGIEDAAGLRDRLRAALDRQRGAGLGNPEETPAAGGDDLASLAAAAAALAAETRRLRRAFEPQRHSEASPT